MKANWVHKIRRSLRRGSLVLMYHRIAEPVHDPWGLAVSPPNFLQHLQVLSQTGNVIPLHELIRKAGRSISAKSYFAITFDDGYADNYNTARPMLEAYSLPATFFITSQNIGTAKEFWWDELERILLYTTHLPAKLSLVINHQNFTYAIDPFRRSELIEQFLEKPMHQVPNIDLYLQLWQHLQPLHHSEQQKVIENLRAWAGRKEIPATDYSSMSREQLLKLSSSSLFEIGGHTVHHTALAFHTKQFQEKEIKENRQWLEEALTKKVRLFAYPHGIYNQATLDIMKQENFDGALTTKVEPVHKRSDKHQLGRFQVKNWTGEEFEKQLVAWLKAH